MRKTVLRSTIILALLPTSFVILYGLSSNGKKTKNDTSSLTWQEKVAIAKQIKEDMEYSKVIGWIGPPTTHGTSIDPRLSQREENYARSSGDFIPKNRFWAKWQNPNKQEQWFAILFGDNKALMKVNDDYAFEALRRPYP